MKILVISHEYPPIGGGGGKVVEELSQGLAQKEHQLHLLTAHYGSLPKLERLENLTIERLPSWRSEPFRADLKAMAAFIIKAFFRGLKVFRDFKPDFIHAHFAVPAGAAAFLLAKATGMPYVITAHGGDVPGGAPEKTAGWFRLALPFSKLIWKHAATVAAVSNQTRELAMAHYHADIRVIPNGIDTEAMKPRDLSVHTPPRVVFIGRFSPEKNAIAVPKILGELKDLDWQCDMLGDGVEMGEVRRLIDEHGLSGRVRLLGWQEPDGVKATLAQSDILLMPSYREGMPMAALQALSMGLALLLPNKGSCPDMIRGNGFLLEPGDLDGYTTRLESLLRDKKSLAECKSNSRRLSADFDIAKIINAYEQLFQDVLRQKVS